MVPVSLVPEVPARFWVKVLDCLCFCLVPGVGACAPCLCLGVGAVCCLPAAGLCGTLFVGCLTKGFVMETCLCFQLHFVSSLSLSCVSVF